MHWRCSELSDLETDASLFADSRGDYRTSRSH